MLTKLWCLFIGGILITLGITGNVARIVDKWEVVGYLGFFTVILGVIQTLYDNERNKQN